jgi:hypothetical protein
MKPILFIDPRVLQKDIHNVDFHADNIKDQFDFNKIDVFMHFVTSEEYEIVLAGSWLLARSPEEVTHALIEVWQNGATSKDSVAYLKSQTIHTFPAITPKMSSTMDRMIRRSLLTYERIHHKGYPVCRYLVISCSFQNGHPTLVVEDGGLKMSDVVRVVRFFSCGVTTPRG